MTQLDNKEITQVEKMAKVPEKLVRSHQKDTSEIEQENTVRGKVRYLTTKSTKWEYFVIAIILINAFCLGLETNLEIYEKYGTILEWMDNIVVAFFIIEISIRIYGEGFSFFKKPWGIFDFTIVFFILISANEDLSVLRTMRVLRIFHLINMVPSLKQVITGLFYALKGMGSIFLLIMLVFYVFSVMATKMFGQNFPEWFGTLGNSSFTLFQIMTLESWAMGIVRPVMEKQPNSWIFFVSFICCTAYSVLNLITGVIVHAMQKEHLKIWEKDYHAETEKVTEEFNKLRREVKIIEEKLDKVLNLRESENTTVAKTSNETDHHS